MKKSLLASALIAATALTVPAFANSILPALVDGAGSSTATRLDASNRPEGWDQNIGVPSSISAEVVKACYDTGVFSLTGWYWGMGNYQDANSSDLKNVSATSFTFDGRYNYSGEYVAAVVNLSDILGDNEELSSFSLSFTYSGTTVSFSVYCIDLTTDTTSVTQLYTTTSTGNISWAWNPETEEEYLSSDYALMFIWNSNSSGSEATVSDLSSSYTVTTIPEPSMFGLFFGLGAIGLVATRRRRRA